MHYPLKDIPAEITFQHLTTGRAATNVWTARLLNPDTLDCGYLRGQKIITYQDNVIARIEERADGGYDYWIQGGDRGGRRYRFAETLDAAQAHVRKWAGRRFRTEVPADH